MATETNGFKASWQQVTVTVIAAVIIGVLSFGASSYLNLQKEVHANHESIQAIQLSIPETPPQIVVNEAVNGKIKSISESLDSLSIDNE